VRPVRVLDNDAEILRAPGGVTYLASRFPLGPYPDRLTDKLDEWAEKAPDRIFLADRCGPPGPLRGSRPTTPDDVGRDPRIGHGAKERKVFNDIEN